MVERCANLDENNHDKSLQRIGSIYSTAKLLAKVPDIEPDDRNSCRISETKTQINQEKDSSVSSDDKVKLTNFIYLKQF